MNLKSHPNLGCTKVPYFSPETKFGHKYFLSNGSAPLLFYGTNKQPKHTYEEPPATLWPCYEPELHRDRLSSRLIKTHSGWFIYMIHQPVEFVKLDQQCFSPLKQVSSVWLSRAAVHKTPTVCCQITTQTNFAVVNSLRSNFNPSQTTDYMLHN